MKKLRLRKIPASSVTVGMRIWSPGLNETFTVEYIYTRGASMFLIEGIFRGVVAKRGYVWQEVKD